MPIGPTGTFPRRDLQLVVSEREVDPTAFIRQLVLPDLPVDEKGGSLFQLPGWQKAQIPDMARAPRSAYARVQSELEEVEYATKEYGLEEPIDDGERNRYRNFIDADLEVTENLVEAHRIRQERACAALLFNRTTFPASGNDGFDVSTEWSTSATAVPATDVAAAGDMLRIKTGVPMIRQWLVLNEKNARNVALTEQYRLRMKVDSERMSATPDADALALFFGVERVLIGRAAYNAAGVGLTESFSDIWDDEYASLIVPSRGMRGAQLGRTFVWTGDGGPMAVENYREEPMRSDVLRVRNHEEQKVFSNLFAVLMGNIAA